MMWLVNVSFDFVFMYNLLDLFNVNWEVEVKSVFFNFVGIVIKNGCDFLVICIV